MAQTFTPGITGLLTSISVDLFVINDATAVTLAIIPVTAGGFPDTTAPPFASVTQDLSAATGFFSFDLTSQNFHLTQGQQIAYWLTAGDTARWISDIAAFPYAGGEDFIRFPGATDGSPIDWTARGSAAYFQTFVDPLPEPATMGILGSGLIALALLSRRRR